MSARTNKLISLGLATAAIAYGCYPYVSGARPDIAVPPAKPSQLSPRLLAPDLPPVGLTDPFRLSVATPRATVPAAPTLQTATSAARRTFDPKTALAGLTLDGVTILGTQRFAIINGRVYPEGAALARAVAEGVPAVVARVERDRVVVRADGRELELRYGRRSASGKAIRRRNASGVARGRHGPEASLRTDRRDR